MKTFLFGTLFFFVSLPVFTQNEIGGIINRYAKVVDIDACEAIFTTATTPIFSIGDEVLIIQMQGAEINESNSDNFGDVTNLSSAGLFERNEILNIVGTQVFLKYNLVNNYDVGGSVQLVDIPSYDEALVTENLSAFSWNGDFGGVLALQANTLILDANIDVSGQGFRGGVVNPLSSDCGFFTNADDYHYSLSNWRGAPKGEGIAVVIEGKEQGRGAQANGGGGGNDHNSGGGGGSNLTKAGEGGKQSVGGFGCDGDFPGERGKALEEMNNRIFMGGGGGAGHVNNAGTGSSGGNGGGIILLFVDELVANGYNILANGETPNGGVPTNGDGQGGGGAGGSIFLDLGSSSDLNIQANGGHGGNVNNPIDRCFGPGGGGGGGRLIANLPITTVELLGGEPGINTTSSSQCSDPSNSADAGEDGFITDFENIPFSNIEVSEVVVLEQPQSQTVCEGNQVTFSFLLQGPSLGYLWQFNDGTGWQNVQPSPTITGFNTNSLTYFEPTINMTGWQVRCLVSGSCTDDILSLPANMTVLPGIEADFMYTAIGGGEVQFTNLSNGALTFLWDFGDTFTSTEENPTHIYSDFGQFTVSLTLFGECGEVTISETIDVATAPTASFSGDVPFDCVPMVVQFFNESSSNFETLEWFFPGGNPVTSTEINPEVEYTSSGLYDVSLIASNAEGSDTLTLLNFVNAKGPPVLDFSFNIDMLDVQFVNFSQNATNGFFWDFGDMNTSTEENPFHTYATEGLYEVSLTASNDCGETTYTQTVATGQFPLAHFSAFNSSGCAPIEVQFNDLSGGSNLSGWQWQFPGGVPTFSLEQNPVVIYASPGNYDVTLTVFNDFGEHTIVEENLVIVEPFPQPDFLFEVNDATVDFFNNSTGGVSYFWDFGDNQTSTLISPQHQYASPGLYEVVLTVLSNYCGSTIAKDIWIEGPNSTHRNEQEAGVFVFPNPTEGLLNIHLDKPFTGEVQLQLMDISGRGLLREKFNVPKQVIDLSSFPGGLYLLEISNDESKAYFKVILE